MSNPYSLASLLVKFQFDGDAKSELAFFTYEQFSNLKKLPITIKCELVKNQKATLSQHEVDILNKKIASVFSKSKPHAKILSDN